MAGLHTVTIKLDGSFQKALDDMKKEFMDAIQADLLNAMQIQFSATGEPRRKRVRRRPAPGEQKRSINLNGVPNGKA